MIDTIIRFLIKSFGHLGFGERKWVATSQTAASPEEHAAFLAKLGPVMTEFEDMRRATNDKVVSATKLYAPLALVASVPAIMLATRYLDEPSPLLTTGLLMTGAMYLATARPAAAYRAEFKAKVLPHFFARFGLDGYTTEPRIKTEALNAIDVFTFGTTFKTEDEFSGTYRGHVVALAELEVTAPSGKDETATVFEGIVMQFELPHAVQGTTVIYPSSWTPTEERKTLFGFARTKSKSRLEPVVLESPDFAKTYTVMSDDQVGARVLLRPAFMERMLQMKSKVSDREIDTMGGFQSALLAAMVGGASKDPTRFAGMPSRDIIKSALKDASLDNAEMGQNIFAVAKDGQLLIAVPKSESIDYFEPPPYYAEVDVETLMLQMSGDIEQALDIADAIIDLDSRTRHAPIGLRLMKELSAA